MSCAFCEYLERRDFIFENDLAFAIYDHFPVNHGHVLIIPKRHFPSLFEATNEEILACYELIGRLKERLDGEHHPDAYNIGVNAGEAAGQTVFHMHIHMIPRYQGDVPNPRGGIRKFKKPIWKGGIEQ